MQAYKMLAHMPDYVRNDPLAGIFAEKYGAQENRKAIPGEACPRCGCRLGADGSCAICGYDHNTTDKCLDCGCRYNLINLSGRLCPVCGLEKELVLAGIFTPKSEVYHV